MVLCPSAIQSMVGALAERAPELKDVRWVAVETATGVDGADGYQDASLPGRPEDLAYVQLTAGTTRSARGVRVTNASLHAALVGLATGWRCDADSVTVSWQCLSHHQGLVWGVLLPLFVGARAVLISPERVLSRPERWLKAVSKHGATIAIDMGANINSRPEDLAVYGMMASVYAEQVMGRENPRVGLLNVGAEIA